MGDPWKEIAKRLADRDKIENRDSEYYQAFASLAKLISLSGNTDKDRLVKENAHLWEENESLISRLNSQTLRLDTAEVRNRNLASTIKAQEAQVTKLQEKISLLSQQITEKNKQFEIINDEHLISQIQSNVLKDRLNELERQLAAAHLEE